MEFSDQISYNLPMDMLENIPYIDAPECGKHTVEHTL